LQQHSYLGEAWSVLRSGMRVRQNALVRKLITDFAKSMGIAMFVIAVRCARTLKAHVTLC
jgi:hypothetical protein